MDEERFDPSETLKPNHFLYVDGMYPASMMNDKVPWIVRSGSLESLPTLLSGINTLEDEICLSGVCMTVPPQLVFFRIRISDFIQNIDLRVGKENDEGWGSIEEIFEHI
jgi:hypothetical protein